MSNADDSEPPQHGWNQREKKHPVLLYIILVCICGAIAWILSSAGHG